MGKTKNQRGTAANATLRTDDIIQQLARYANALPSGLWAQPGESIEDARRRMQRESYSLFDNRYKSLRAAEDKLVERIQGVHAGQGGGNKRHRLESETIHSKEEGKRRRLLVGGAVTETNTRRNQLGMPHLPNPGWAGVGNPAIFETRLGELKTEYAAAYHGYDTHPTESYAQIKQNQQ